jgi:heme A synthase
LILGTCGTVWLAYRREKWLVIPATAAVFLLIGQALLGGVTVLNELPGEIVAAHLALGEALLACLLLVMVVAYWGPLALRPNGPGHSRPDRFPMLAFVSAIGVYFLILSGSLVTATGATAACLTWPLCQGQLFPEHLLPAIHMGHRFVAAIIGALLLYTLHLGFRDQRRPLEVRLLSMGVASLFLAQVIVGTVTVWLGFPVPFMALHLAMASAVWGAVAALAVLSFTQPRFVGTTAQGATHD